MPPSKKKPKKSSELPDGPKVGSRGQVGMGGWWISLKAAKERSVGEEEWWAYPGRNGFLVDPKQQFRNGSPSPSKPVWLFENGDMYLGNWKQKGPTGQPIEEGFGITYNNYPDKFIGNIYMGEWKDGMMHGEGVSFWLASSEVWTKNHFAASPIKKDTNDGRSPGIPFRYEGSYYEDWKVDQRAVVTLKDGTTRMGPWDEGEPRGGWYSHSLAAVAPRRASASFGARRSTRVADNQEKPNYDEAAEIIDMSDSDDSAAAKPPAIIAAAVTPNDSTKRHHTGLNTVALVNSQAEKQHRLGQIRDWITYDVIGNNPSFATMERYAGSLYEKGFESIELIKTYLKDRHVQSFDWMSELHKEIFLERLRCGW